MGVPVERGGSMSQIPVPSNQLVEVTEELRQLAFECVSQARFCSTAPNVGDDANASLAAKNWSAAALTSVQAWMTAARGPGR